MHVGYWADGAARPTILGGRYEQLKNFHLNGCPTIPASSAVVAHIGTRGHFLGLGTDRPTQSGDAVTTYRIPRPLFQQASKENQCTATRLLTCLLTCRKTSVASEDSEGVTERGRAAASLLLHDPPLLRCRRWVLYLDSLPHLVSSILVLWRNFIPPSALECTLLSGGNEGKPGARGRQRWVSDDGARIASRAPHYAHFACARHMR